MYNIYIYSIDSRLRCLCNSRNVRSKLQVLVPAVACLLLLLALQLTTLVMQSNSYSVSISTSFCEWQNFEWRIERTGWPPKFWCANTSDLQRDQSSACHWRYMIIPSMGQWLLIPIEPKSPLSFG